MSALSETFWDLPHICSVLQSQDGEPNAIPDLGKLWSVHQVPIQPFYHPEVVTLLNITRAIDNKENIDQAPATAICRSMLLQYDDIQLTVIYPGGGIVLIM